MYLKEELSSSEEGYNQVLFTHYVHTVSPDSYALFGGWVWSVVT